MNVAELSEMVGGEKRALDTMVRKLSSEQFRRPANDKPDVPYEGATLRLDQTEQGREPAAGEWTVRDVLGHVAAYADAERRALAAGVGRGREDVITFEHFQPWNEQQYELRRRRTPSQIVAELQENTARFLSLVKSLHEEDLIKTIKYPWRNAQGTVHAFILECMEHQREHREELGRLLGNVERRT